MGRFEKPIQALLLFLFMLGVFILLNRYNTQSEVLPTATYFPTNTIIPTLTFTPTAIPSALPTITSPPPVLVAPVFVIPDDGGVFNGNFFTATVCNNVPVFSQPASNYNLIIGELYKGNLVDVTGQSQFWSRISYMMGQVGYVPTDYIEC